ncbi:MAG: DinB family protein [Thermoproteota archaeon]|nr:DinB family protein [Thermoproteota archaeon]
MEPTYMDLISFIKEIFQYNHTVRQNFIDIFKKKLTWEEVIKNRETAWLSLKDTLLHIIWVEDSWINYSIHDLNDPNRPFPYKKYDNWNSITNYNAKVVYKTDHFISADIKTESDLLKPVHRKNIDGITRKTVVKDVLFHVITEELHHRGEIIAILWQMDIQPPDMGWLSVMKKTDQLWEMK